MILRLAVQYGEQLDPIVRAEFEQLITSLQAQFTFLLPTVPVANLPIVAVTGTLCNVTDSATQVWGATVAGGGFYSALVRYNGSRWTIVGI